jgi:hypothetical protein
VPPWLSATAWAMARPRPAPPVERLRDLGAVERLGGAGELVGRQAGASVGDRDSDRPARPAATRTSAEPPYLTALSTRLRSARRSRSERIDATARPSLAKVTFGAQLGELVDDGLGQGGDVDPPRRLAQPPRAGEDENVLEHRRHFLGDGDDPVAGLAFLDRFGAEAQRGERGPQIVADRAEHPVLLVEQGRDPGVHRVERLDRPLEVARAARLDHRRRFAAAEALRAEARSRSGRTIRAARNRVAPSTTR